MTRLGKASRICPSCATAIPTCFCICLECEAQLISTGRFCVNISSDDDDDEHEPNVSGDARRTQEEANDNAAAQEKDGGMEDDPKDDDMGTQGYTSGNVPEEEDNEWDYRDNDMAARDIINSQRMAICMDEPREAQYMAGFIALQMSRLWGMFAAGKKRTTDVALKGALACPYHNDLGRYPNITEFDRDGIVLPSNEHKISQSQNVRTRTFRTVEERNQYIQFVIWRSNVRGCTFSTNCGLRQGSSTSPRNAGIQRGTLFTGASLWHSTASTYLSR